LIVFSDENLVVFVRRLNILGVVIVTFFCLVLVFHRNTFKRNFFSLKLRHDLLVVVLRRVTNEAQSVSMTRQELRYVFIQAVLLFFCMSPIKTGNFLALVIVVLQFLQLKKNLIVVLWQLGD